MLSHAKASPGIVCESAEHCGTHPQRSGLGSQGQNLGICMFSKFSGDANSGGPQTTWRETLPGSSHL